MFGDELFYDDAQYLRFGRKEDRRTAAREDRRTAREARRTARTTAIPLASGTSAPPSDLN